MSELRFVGSKSTVRIRLLGSIFFFPASRRAWSFGSGRAAELKWDTVECVPPNFGTKQAFRFQGVCYSAGAGWMFSEIGRQIGGARARKDTLARAPAGTGGAPVLPVVMGEGVEVF